MGIACPHCHGALADGADASLACCGCGRVFPIYHDIPDLRTIGDPYLSTDADYAAASRLARLAATLGFAELYASYYEGNDKVPKAQVAQFTRGVIAAEGRAEASVGVWEGMTSHADNGITLDLGCGTAPLSTVLARRAMRVVGLDAGLRWLVIARARAAAAGIDLPLVCANAEALPFRDGTLTRVAGESILENVAAPERAIGESHRVLAAGGQLWLTTANRLSLAPDPHLGVLAGGWWPEQRLRAHAERTGKVFPKRRLFTAGELVRTLEASGFGAVRVALPRFSETQVRSLSAPARTIVAGYHFARRLPQVPALLLRVGPSLVCTAIRE